MREPGHTRGTVLVVDDDEGTGRLARRHLRRWTVTQALTLAAAQVKVEAATDLRLVLLDLDLPDAMYPEPLRDKPFQGSFGLARGIRQTCPSLPVVILSARVDGAIVNAAHLVGVELVSKEDPAANFDLLCRRLEVTQPSEHGQWPYLTWLREHRGMTPRELEVASLAIQGITRYAELGDLLGISPNTVKRHVARVLDRAGVDSLVDFVLRARGIRP